MVDREARIRASGTQDAVADLVELALRREGWRVHHVGRHAGTARAGSVAAHLVVGGLAPAHLVTWGVDVSSAGEVVVTLVRGTDGAFGGALGRRRVRRRFERLVDVVRSVLDERGALAA